MIFKVFRDHRILTRRVRRSAPRICDLCIHGSLGAFRLWTVEDDRLDVVDGRQRIVPFDHAKVGAPLPSMLAEAGYFHDPGVDGRSLREIADSAFLPVRPARQ